jgi:hypothetical protein
VYMTYLRAWGPGLLLPVLYLAIALFDRSVLVSQNFWLSFWSERTLEWQRREAVAASSDRGQQFPSTFYMTMYFSFGIFAMAVQAVRATMLVVATLNASQVRAHPVARRRACTPRRLFHNAQRLPAAVECACEAGMRPYSVWHRRTWRLGAAPAGTLHVPRHMLGALQVLHDRLVDKVLSLPMAFFDTQPSGRLCNRFTRDVEATDVNLQGTISSFTTCISSVAMAVLVVGGITRGAVLAAIAPLSFVYRSIQVYYLATSRELKRLDSIALSPIFSNFTETLAGLMTVRAFRKQVRCAPHAHACAPASLGTRMHVRRCPKRRKEPAAPALQDAMRGAFMHACGGPAAGQPLHAVFLRAAEWQRWRSSAERLLATLAMCSGPEAQGKPTAELVRLPGCAARAAARMQEAFSRHNEALMDSSARVWWPIQVGNRWLSIRLELMGQSVVLVTAASVSLFIGHSGLAGLALTSALSVVGLMNWATRQGTELEMGMNSVERMTEYLQHTSERAAVVPGNRCAPAQCMACMHHASSIRTLPRRAPTPPPRLAARAAHHAVTAPRLCAGLPHTGQRLARWR